MCGIFGFVGKRSDEVERAVRRGTRALAHRGPDDEGVALLPLPDEGILGLGVRRLAIQDLSPAAHQPMRDPESSNWVAFNGEIYNFRSIREELERRGRRFTSTGDTEVLLQAYVEWGEACLEKLQGMFAFAIWDAARERLFLARDPLGVKPLYYATSPQGLLFGSEVRALVKSGLAAGRLDQAAVASYLAFGAVQEPLTILESVRSLLPGCALVWEKGRSTIHRYWSLGEVAAREPHSDHAAEAVRGIRNLLRQSVALRLISDLPVGLFLSGGIDSSCVLALAAEASCKPLDTLSVVFDEDECNESAYSELVARRFGSRHHVIRLGVKQLLEQLPDALLAMDQPTIDGLNTYVVSGAARAAGLKVALSGVGGDELFAGYTNFHRVPRMATCWKLAGWAAPLAKSVSTAVRPAARRTGAKALALLAGDFCGHDPYFLSRALFLPSEAARLTGSPGLVNGANPALARLGELSQAAQGLDPIQRVSVLEASTYLPNMLLRDMDAMSMAHGLEVRDPLLDRRLWEFVLPLRKGLKMRRGVPKPLLLGTVLDKLPEEVYRRPKRGFQFPYEAWMRGLLRMEIERTLSPNGKSREWGLCAGAVANVWRSFLRGKTTWSRPWALFVLKQWIGHNVGDAK